MAHLDAYQNLNILPYRLLGSSCNQAHVCSLTHQLLGISHSRITLRKRECVCVSINVLFGHFSYIVADTLLCASKSIHFDPSWVWVQAVRPKIAVVNGYLHVYSPFNVAHSVASSRVDKQGYLWKYFLVAFLACLRQEWCTCGGIGKYQKVNGKDITGNLNQNV